MYGICIECSFSRGMGHFFRAVNFIKYLASINEDYILILNDDGNAKQLLRSEGISNYVIVDVLDECDNWEQTIISTYGITVWLNDRLDTSAKTARNVTLANVPLFTIDDRGDGAEYALGNFASLIFEDVEHLPGKQVYSGLDYLVLNPEINSYRKVRSTVKNILITMGGSDTYSVTPLLVNTVKEFFSISENEYYLTVILGPDSQCLGEVIELTKGTNICVEHGVDSLIKCMSDNDIAITGGGVTAVEAAAAGLPTVIVANELHEIQVGEYLEKSGCSVYAGYYKDLSAEGVLDCLTRAVNDVERLSKNGLRKVHMDGAANIVRTIEDTVR